jgi:hypothetical protein
LGKCPPNDKEKPYNIGKKKLEKGLSDRTEDPELWGTRRGKGRKIP